MWSNFHTHSKYCDGKGELTDLLVSAREKKVSTLGFSSHAPVPFACKWCMKKENLPIYLDDVKNCASIDREMEIYAGLEIDFIPGVVSADDFRDQLDYTIGSIHFIDAYDSSPWEIDGSHEVFKEGLNEIFKNKMRDAIARYFELTREMIRDSPPDILGHMDKIKIQNKEDTVFEESESWYRSEVEKTLQVIRHANIIVEVNTRGIYQKKSAVTYPSPWILEKILKLNIPITLSSDAHHPDQLINEFQVTATALKNMGFRHLSILNEGVWKQMPFDQNGIIV